MTHTCRKCGEQASGIVKGHRYCDRCLWIKAQRFLFVRKGHESPADDPNPGQEDAVRALEDAPQALE